MNWQERPIIDPAVEKVFTGRLRAAQSATDCIFARLLVGQWCFGIACALYISPRTWAGAESQTHLHVWAATVLGGLVISLPLVLIALRSGDRVTRLVVAASQLMYSSLLIHLLGGRIEAHFHVFGSLAILAFYRDLWVFVPAVIVVSADHLFRALFWPESVFGVLFATPWRAVEHVGWMLFETSLLAWGIRQSRADLHDLSIVHVSLTAERDMLERNVERRVAELSQQRILLQDVVDSIPIAVFWKDFNRRYQGCNRAFVKLAGASSSSDVIGKSDEDLLWPPEQKQWLKRTDWEALLARTAVLDVERQLTDASGRTQQVLTSNIPLVDFDDQVVGVIGVMQDVSDRRRLEAQLAQAQKLEAIGQLAAGIAHEINTPMQCVGGNVEFLRSCYERLFHVVDAYREFLEGPQQKWSERRAEMHRLVSAIHYEHLRTQTPAAVEEAAAAIQRVIEIVRAMKAMAHPGTQAKQATNVNELVRDAVAISRNRWKLVAEMNLQLDDSLPDICALPAELSQVLLNLIVNAADAIAEKGAEANRTTGRITITTARENQGVTLTVADTGAGMSDAVRRRVFDPYFTTKPVGKGTGQGLAIAYDLVVNKHQGRIHVESAPARGSSFVVWLPAETGCSPAGAADLGAAVPHADAAPSPAASPCLCLAN